ncbi:SWIM zinc finger family protein [Hyalangium sp.]|uniref:SWIM zinc finger family protein n=1 Tax=Hyalangium sp. TaxID=2028555 RepID=UPI002D4653B4|nr:SWIM zinc finger family protein [Hyalangium sp.]HYH94401.1 SWIM zinc finger family protein [Hyalangium sp.]
MSDWDERPWYFKKAPKRPPPKRGIKVKQLGATWWGERWIEALEKFSGDYSNRLSRGRTYARAGRVSDLKIALGQVTAHVTGSRPKPYKVTLRLSVLPEKAWEKAIQEMARQAVFAAELLMGQMPRDIDKAFQAAGQSLFPVRAKDLETDCTCPDWANPCKHIAATHYVLGEAFDKDPFLLFELRGWNKAAMLERLRRLREGKPARRAGSSSKVRAEPHTVPLTKVAPGTYERMARPLSHLRFQIEPPAAPVALLRQLGVPSSWTLQETPAEVLAPLYTTAGAFARDLALKPLEEPARPPSRAPPGARRRRPPP